MLPTDQPPQQNTNLSKLRRVRSTGEPIRLKIISPSDAEQNLFVQLQWSDHWIKYELIKALGQMPEIVVTDHQPNAVLHLFGFPTPLDPRFYTMGWIYGHPELITDFELAQYDHLFCYSTQFLEELRRRGFEVELMLGATGKKPRHDVNLRYPATFVGNARPRGGGRLAVEALLETGEPFLVWGHGWQGRLPQKNFGGEYFDYGKLEELYAASEFSLNDHHPDMRRWGFVSFRLYDILASGGFAVSDRNDGIAEIFGDSIPQFSDGKELREILSHFRAHPEQRERLIKQGMKAALSHTWEKRAEQIRQRLLSVTQPERQVVDIDYPHPAGPDPEAQKRIEAAYCRLGETQFAGSSTQPSTAYHELPFPEINLPVHRRNLVERVAPVLRRYNPRGKYGVDLGCAVGGFTFAFQIAGARMLGIDYDNAAIEVAEACEEAYRTGARFLQADIDLPLIETLSQCHANSQTGGIDFCIWYSHFMWMVKQQGVEVALDALFALSKQCNDLWFETSMGDAQAGDAMQNLGLTNAASVQEMLEVESCYQEVTDLGPVNDGWHPRPIFHCRKPRWEWEGITSRIIRIGRKVIRKQVCDEKGGHTGLLRCLKYEIEALRRLESLSTNGATHFPRILGSGDDYVELEFCGQPLTRDKLPADWERQVAEIIAALERAGIIHRDIRPDNLLVKGGIIKLIDFGWAVPSADAEKDVPRRLGGDWKHPAKFDDRYSLEKSLGSIMEGWRPSEGHADSLQPKVHMAEKQRPFSQQPAQSNL